jgi:hypothetical protein
MFVHSSGGGKPKIQMFTGLVSFAGSSLGLYMAAYSLCPHMIFLCILMTLNFPFLNKQGTSNIGLQQPLKDLILN